MRGATVSVAHMFSVRVQSSGRESRLTDGRSA